MMGKKESRLTLRVSNFDDLSMLVPPTESENEVSGTVLGGEEMRSGAAFMI